ncbi:MAG TPA: SagB/ThcOx family dehydrogenase [Thermoanaerobaculia bacterium]|nr:SagB/ThcOx family dehydrogenase [Thermoanaerobaculia bacterium]
MTITASPPAVCELPPPQVRFTCSFEETLRLRRSIRAYRRAPVTLGAAGQLLWAAQGITDGEGHRTSPSAGSVYPLEAVLIAGDVEELDAGVFRYRPDRHRIDLVRSGDIRALLARACLDQEFIADASLSILLLADGRAMEEKYGAAAASYIAIEAGCALQNMALQAVALDLGSVIIGAFHEPLLSELLELSTRQRPVSMLTIGHPAP